MDKQVIISIQAILFAALLIAAIWVIIKIFPVLIALFISALLALTLTPLLDWAQERKVPRGFSTAFLYIIILSLIASVGVAGLRPVSVQMSRLFEFLPQYIEKSLGFSDGPFSESLQVFIKGQLNATSNNFLQATLGAFSGTLFIISVLVFTFYLLVEFDEVKRMFVNLFPTKKRKEAENLVRSIEHVLGSYMRGQLLLGILVGLVTFVGLKLLGIEYALSLAIFAGVLEIVPVIGPILSAIPALIVAIPEGPWLVVGVAILYTLIQQLENNLLVPKVMQKSVGLNPLVTLIILLTGGALFGMAGIILAIPTALVGYLVVVEFFNDLFEFEHPWKNRS